MKVKQVKQLNQITKMLKNGGNAKFTVHHKQLRALFVVIFVDFESGLKIVRRIAKKSDESRTNKY